MKKCLRIISAFVTAAIMLSSVQISVFAEEKTTPSGIAFSDIGAKIEEYTYGEIFASYQTAVFCGNETVYTGRFGYYNNEDNIAADENSVYEWGSITKTLVWVSVMQLYEQGRIDLDEDIRAYLPDGFFTRLKYDDKITMMHLMNHQGGWQEVTGIIETSDENEILPLGDILKRSEPYQVFRPGEVTSYSNWGAALAGYVVECITGESFSDYVHKNLFDVLGMEHTAILPDHSDTPWVKEQRKKMGVYNVVDYGGNMQIMKTANQLSFVMPYPAGAATGTIDDLCTYGKAFVSDSCPLFEKQETLELLLSPTSYYGDTDIPQSCHGFWTSFFGVTVKGHSGATNGGSANMVFDRESKTGCVVLSNQIGESCFNDGIPKLIFGSSSANPELNKNASPSESDISGKYLVSRSFFKGIPSIPYFMSYYKMEKSEDGSYILSDSIKITEAGGGLFLMVSDDNISPIGYSVTADGKKLLSLGSTDLIESRDIPFKECMVYGYIIIAVISFILLMIKWIRVIIKRWKKYSGYGFIILSQAARVISCASIAVLFVCLSANSAVSGLHGIVTGAIQISCLICYIVSFIMSSWFLFSKNDSKADSVVYIADDIMNVISASAVIVLQLWIVL